jgi:hypothetical protein
MPKKTPTKEPEMETNNGNIVMSNEQFSQLINALRDTSTQNASASAPLPAQLLSGSFAKCSARFNGEDTSDVDAFLDNVKTYKDICNVSDDNALRGISMLLVDQASTWWIGVKSNIKTWNDAVATLTETFSRKLPPHVVFREIFSREQNTDETTETFVCRIRALFAQLPYELPLEAQIDMILGLLFRKIRKRLIRSELNNFNDLLSYARQIERSLIESDDSKISSKVSKESDRQNVRPRCSFCKNFGHLKDERQKLQKKKHKSVPNIPDTQTVLLIAEQIRVLQVLPYTSF